MKSLFQFLSVPVSVLALALILAVAGGVENGTIPFFVGVVAAALMVGIEVVAIRATAKREDREDEE